MEKQSFLYGAVIKLTRQDTLEDIERNFKQMREAGLDTAVVWPAAFWWEEKREGYPFNTGREILKIAASCGLRIIMELAGQLPQFEYIPDFQMKDEYYMVDEDGHRKLKTGSFGWLNYFHPEVNDLICRHFTAAAKAYKDYEALVAYDVFNETAFCSYDGYTMERFRVWLKKKYKTIEHLNDVWERTYSNFSEVSYAPWIWMSVMPEADWGAFIKESVPMVVKGWCDAIRKVDNKHPFIADNIGSMVVNTDVYRRPQDDFRLKEAVDDIGMSFYPKQVSGCRDAAWRWSSFDAVYAASNREGFYVSEMQTHIQALFNPSTAVRPYELKQWCYESLAAGAKGLIYWMWRPFTKGLQTMGRGLVDYKNRETPRLQFAKALSEYIAGAGALTPVRSGIGILYDDRCEDLQRFYTYAYEVDDSIYGNSVCGAYRALMQAGVHADIVRLHEIKNYKVIVLTNHLRMDEEDVRALTEFVENGGTVICDGKTGIVDGDSMLQDELPGGGFNSYMGISYIDTDYEGLDFTLKDKTYQGFYGRDIVEVTDAEVLAEFADSSPAITHKRNGKGSVISIQTYLGYSATKGEKTATELAGLLADHYKLRDVTVDGDLMVRISENKKEYFAFVFNYTDAASEGYIKGYGFDRNVRVEAQDVLVLRREKI